MMIALLLSGRFAAPARFPAIAFSSEVPPVRVKKTRQNNDNASAPTEARLIS
jgi:hypothetical protein